MIIDYEKETVVYVSFPTSNHNYRNMLSYSEALYMSLFLHQTTTLKILLMMLLGCICLFSYIKPQQKGYSFNFGRSCICLFSYIKPQLRRVSFYLMFVVYVSFPTSNHNLSCVRIDSLSLYMSLFLHQTTTFILFYI